MLSALDASGPASRVFLFFRREFSSQVKRWSLFDEKGGGGGAGDNF